MHVFFFIPCRLALPAYDALVSLRRNDTDFGLQQKSFGTHLEKQQLFGHTGCSVAAVILWAVI